MSKHSSRWWLLGGLAVALATPATASEPVAPAPASVDIHGSKVGVDPATGKLRALSAAERQALGRSLGATLRTREPEGNGRKGFVLPRTAADAREWRATGGAVVQQVSLGEMSALTVEQAADGSLKIGHAGPGQTAPAHHDHEER